MRIDGSCHCGRITFEAEADPEKAGICHCNDCQALSGSAFTTFLPVPKEAFELRGEPKVYVKLYATSEKDPQVFNIRTGTVRQRAQLPPKSQLWCRSAMPWVTELDQVRQYPKQPG